MPVTTPVRCWMAPRTAEWTATGGAHDRHAAHQIGFGKNPRPSRPIGRPLAFGGKEATTRPLLALTREGSRRPEGCRVNRPLAAYELDDLDLARLGAVRKVWFRRAGPRSP
jgi:hypothetical protein